MTIEQNIVQILTQCRDEIRANMASKGINASGRTSAGFKVVQNGDSIVLMLDRSAKVEVPCEPRGIGSVFAGVAPLETVEIGRGGGKVPRGFYYLIKQWSRDKGMQFGSETERQRFAYFTARKITREGTRRHTTPMDVYSTPVNKAVDMLRKNISIAISTNIHNVVTNF